MSALAPLWLLFACTSGDVGSDVEDRDGDGHAADVDCDDADPRRAPGFEEECDHLDNDCDSLTDEDDPDLVDGAIWFVDADGDGVGDGTAAVTACVRAEGYAGSAGDCDDTDATVSTSAPWYRDEDGDGYGDASSSLTACGAPVDHVSDATDCDDTDGGVNPGEAEVCGDGVDQDCDGAPNGCGPTGDVALPGDAWQLEEDDDFGVAVAGLGVGTFAVSAPGYDDDAGEVSVWEWREGGFSVAAYLSGDTPGERAGSVLSAGDVDGDGVMDLLVAGTTGRGAWLVRGPFPDNRDLADAEAVLDPLESGTIASLSVLGDQDEDDVPEILVGVSGGAGTAGYVVSGGVTGTIDLGAAIASFAGGRSFSGASGAGLGDTDGDGIGDAALTNTSGTDTLSSQGIVYVLPGPLSGETALPDVTTRLLGEDAFGGTGMHVTAAGDVDGDGYADVLVGGPATDDTRGDEGAAWLVRGPVTTTVGLGEADWIVRGDAYAQAVGQSAVAADVDGDGRPDFVIGAAGDTAGTGLTLLCNAPFVGEIVASDADARLVGPAPGSGAGRAVGSAGDADDDGDDDVVVAAPGIETVFVVKGGVGL